MSREQDYSFEIFSVVLRETTSKGIDQLTYISFPSVAKQRNTAKSEALDDRGYLSYEIIKQFSGRLQVAVKNFRVWCPIYPGDQVFGT